MLSNALNFIGFSILLFPISLLPTSVMGKNTIKVCTKEGEVHDVSTESCKRGAWAAEGLQVDCVCANGLWILSENFCDKEFFIIASRENECFKVDRPIRRFLSLMSNEDLTAEKIYYFKGKLESFQTFKSNLSLTSKTIPGDGETSFIVRYNGTKPIYVRHEEGVPSKFWQKCYKPSEDLETFQLIQSDSATFFSKRDDCEEVRDLKFGYGSDKKTVWDLSMGSIWHSKFGIEKASKKCSKSCGTQTEKLQKENNKSRKRSTSHIKPVDDNTIIGDSFDEDSLTVKEEDYDNLGIDLDISKDLDVMTERLRDNGRDTIRMANKLKKWIFHNIPGPIVAQKEFKYLQLARVIFLKTCPSVDGQTLTNFMRLFRFLVYDTLKRYPDSYASDTEDRVHKRILDTLRKCFKNVTPYKVTLDTNPCVDLEADDDAGGGGVEVISIADSKGAIYSPTINSSAEDEMDFKVEKQSDTVLETVFKLMLHTHYQCSEEFRKHPEDLSWMFIKLQEFLTTPHIMFRWENPGDYLHKVYGFMHPGFKLQKFAKTIDACVSAAKESSLFAEWLQRPKRQRDFQGSAVMGRSMTLLGAKGEGKPTLFKGKGYCVNKFDDPITWTNFNSEVNAKCH